MSTPFSVTADCSTEAHTPARCGVTGAQPGGMEGSELPAAFIRGEDGAMVTHYCATLADAVALADSAWLIHASKAQSALRVREAEEAWAAVRRWAVDNTRQRNGVVSQRPAPGPARQAYEAEHLAPLLVLRDRLRVEERAARLALVEARRRRALWGD